MKNSLHRIKIRYGANEARIPQKYQVIGHEFAIPFDGIYLTTANMDMKII